ncbi:DUF4031 domain-containing protein [Rhodanobacter sp. 115]|uniref:DUF4031 domain-containing protein n=1 Tax=Rhodanobacter sp. FW021-MT20 TaxID=1162282 RepID=UPI0034E499F7
MAVYVDEADWSWRGRRWAHLMADSLNELHAFAFRLGLKRAWFQAKPGGAAHYDVTDTVRARALALGAVALVRPGDSETLKAVIRRAREQLRSPEFVASKSEE